VLGANVTVVRSQEVTLEELVARHPSPSHLVISPGPGHPLRDSGISIPTLLHFAGKVPVLGICMGLQCIYAAYGGQVDGAGEIIHGKASDVAHDGKGLFKGVSQGFKATRYHSLAGQLESLPEALEVTCRTREGVPGEKGGIVMGIRHKTFAMEAVQYHPESILSEEGKVMLGNFLKLRRGLWSDNPEFGLNSPASSTPVKSTTPPNPSALPTILTKIAAQREIDVAKAKETPGSLPTDLASLISLHVTPPAINLHQRLLAHNGSSSTSDHVALMAEIKRASPSKGDILPPHSPLSSPSIALSYALAGASVISVLTEPKWFKGSLEDMRAVRTAISSLPNRPAVLRKDFILDTYQIDEARVYGADTVLLIVAMLDDAQLKTLYDYAQFRGMEPLVEVNNAAELDRALAVGAKVIGVNNRNLHDFQVDMSTTTRLADAIKDRGAEGIILCALSGIAGRQDVERYMSQGVGAVLVGESLMRAKDKGAFTRELLGIGPPKTTASANGHTAVSEKSGTNEVAPPKLSPKPLVKICGIRSPEAALAAADAGADFLGLVFVERSKRCVTIEQAKAIIQAVRSRSESSSPTTTPATKELTATDGEPLDWFSIQASRFASHVRRPLLIGVFQDAPLATLLKAIDALHLDAVQLHGTEPAEWAPLLGVPVIRAFHVGSELDASVRQASRPGVHAIPLLDTKVGTLSGGAGKAFDWTVAAQLAAEPRGEGLGRLPFVLAGGLDASNIALAVEQVRPWAVDVSGGVETDGEKDLKKIVEFVHAAKA
jgi:anthranilate synthase/indole-3-glycerol phosphate synthase/phosphoribosylanthranilate isomerase